MDTGAQYMYSNKLYYRVQLVTDPSGAMITLIILGLVLSSVSDSIGE